jgi:pyruvate carboxylase subunit B
MIFTRTEKSIRVMFTAFRDGLQSCFGGNVRVKDVLPAMQASALAGIQHFEFGGGARFQSPYFHVGEDPFACMDEMRRTVGPAANLQILTRSVSGVTLETQRREALRMQARLMKKHGTTWNRNFDYMNDVDNLVRTGEAIVDEGLHHQACVALMGLPFDDDRVHTAEFYVGVVRRLLERGLHLDSVCMKDASGTTDPRTCYETAKGLRKILPPEVLLWQHTHDTASMAVACYMAGIEGGVDGIDLSVRPLASGTSQPDVRSMAHALKGTGYVLDIDAAKMPEIEAALEDGLKDYEFNPVTTSADARVVGFPMPGGAIGPNVHMMKEAGILDRYSAVLAEFPVVVRAGGAWTSVTPGSQQYWLQAFNNVLLGRWKKINDGYGRAVLGYFGRPPLDPDPDVVRLAGEQLRLEPFSGDPLEAAADSLGAAEQALRERGLPVTEENVFLVAAAIVPGKKKAEEAKVAAPTTPVAAAGAPAPPPTVAPAPPASLTGPVTTACTVVEGKTTRHFRITIEPPAPLRAAAAADRPAVETAPAPPAERTPIYSPFEGKVELVEVIAHVGEAVVEGQVVAEVEAMKTKHDVKAPCSGRVVSIDAAVGSDVEAGRSILTLAR